MSEYRCSQCGGRYSHDEYMDLETVSKVTDDPDDKYGVETVCSCGARFHSDKWDMKSDVEIPEAEIEVSTTALIIGHGPNHDQWYETCLFWDGGSSVVRRYHTEMEAKNGHSEVIEKLEDGEYSFETIAEMIRLEE